LEDFKWLANVISSRPTCIAELVPDTHPTLGAVDAAGEGMRAVSTSFLPKDELFRFCGAKSFLKKFNDNFCLGQGQIQWGP